MKSGDSTSQRPGIVGGSDICRRRGGRDRGRHGSPIRRATTIRRWQALKRGPHVVRVMRASGVASRTSARSGWTT